MANVRTAAELAVGDVVQTPSKRSAMVVKHDEPFVLLNYCDAHGEPIENDEVSLRPQLLTYVRAAQPGALPPGFFRQSR